MVAMVAAINSKQILVEGLYDYRPAFLVGKKASKSAYRLIEEIFNESIKQNTHRPIIAKQTLAKRLGVSDKTIQRNNKELASKGYITCIHLGNGYYQYQLLYQADFSLPESCIAYDSEHIQPSSNISPVPTNSLPISSNTPSTIPTPIIESPTAITPVAIMIKVPEPNTTAPATSVALAPAAIAMPAATPTTTITTPAPAQQPGTSLPYTDEQINQIIENLSEEEQDSLIDQIVELLNEWDVTRASELTAIHKRCRTQAFYEQYIYDMAATEVKRRYAISVLSYSQCTNNHSDNINNSQQVTNQTTTPDQNTAQDNLVLNLDHNHLDTNVQPNNFPTPLSSDLEPKDINVQPKTHEDHDPINQSTSVDSLEIELRHKCPSITIFLFTGLNTQITTNVSYTHIETTTKVIASCSPTHTQSQLHAHACVHARVREESDLRKVKVNKVIYNFLTSTSSLGSGSKEKEHVSGTNSGREYNPDNSTTINTDNHNQQGSCSSNNQTQNKIQINNLFNPVVDINTRKSIIKADNSTGNDVTNATEGEIVSPARIERRRLDEKISVNEFVLWKVVSGDYALRQDEDGNYLLPNELNNHPKSKHSFWDILAYAQTQKSIEKPVSFSVKKYYLGGLDNSITFQKYLEEKATNLIGAARQPTEPTQAEKSLSAKFKQDLDYQVMLNNLGEELWQHLSSDEQQSLIARELEELKTSEFFHSHYKNWPKSQLQDHAIHKVKKQLAKAEMCRRERLETGMSLAS